MTAITPMPRWTTPILRVVFWLAAHGFPPKTQKNFVGLTFIHFARWVIIKPSQFPRRSETQPKEDLDYAYLLFISNFNGSWDQYIEAFSLVIPEGMRNIWGWSKGFPGPRPIGPFVDYIHRQQIETDYYYGAYPGASTKDVLGALDANKRYRQLAAQSATMTPDEFRTAFLGFLANVQNGLSTTGPSVNDATPPRARTGHAPSRQLRAAVWPT